MKPSAGARPANQTATQHPITMWQQHFFERRGLKRPTGSYLYTYRTEAGEFEDLEKSLKQMLAPLLMRATLGEISRRAVVFPRLFVLYASEWWRRRYDGSGWSWEPIIEALGAKPDGWNQNERSRCVETGLREWGLGVGQSHGFRFLGSIAFQGGLPMQLLASARGNIGRLLNRVLRLAANGNAERGDIHDWISSLAEDLPRAYRQQEIYALLSEVIVTVLELRRKANLTSSAGALEVLNRTNPTWRSEFPIPVEDSHAQALIEQLVRDAADSRITHRVRKISVERRLEQAGEIWQLRSDVELPEYMEGTELASAFNADPASLSRSLTLKVARGGKIADVALRKLAGKDQYRLERRPLDCLNGPALAEHTMCLIDAEGHVWHSGIARGGSLNGNLPWLFEVQEDCTRPSRFVRQGGGGIGALEALVCVPGEWVVEPEDTGIAKCVGSFAGDERTVWRFRGTIRIKDGFGAEFRARSANAAVLEEELELRGARAWDLPTESRIAFRGLPRLYRVSDGGAARPAAGSLSWHIAGSSTTKTPVGLYGPVDAYYPSEGPTEFKSRLVLLPEEAKVVMEPGASPASGAIHLLNWRLLTCAVDTDDISCSVERHGTDLRLHLRYDGLGVPPEWCDLQMVWAHNPNEVRLRLPFPARGIRVLDAGDNELPQGAMLASGSLHGVRLLAFVGNTIRAVLYLSLHGGRYQSSVRKSLGANAHETRVEIRLIDYAAEIERMLSEADSLDAFVKVELEVGDSSSAIRVGRYSCELLKENTNYSVTLPETVLEHLGIEQVRGLPVHAIRRCSRRGSRLIAGHGTCGCGHGALGFSGKRSQPRSVADLSRERIQDRIPADALDRRQWRHCRRSRKALFDRCSAAAGSVAPTIDHGLHRPRACRGLLSSGLVVCGADGGTPRPSSATDTGSLVLLREISGRYGRIGVSDRFLASDFSQPVRSGIADDVGNHFPQDVARGNGSIAISMHELACRRLANLVQAPHRAKNSRSDDCQSVLANSAGNCEGGGFGGGHSGPAARATGFHERDISLPIIQRSRLHATTTLAQP